MALTRESYEKQKFIRDLDKDLERVKAEIEDLDQDIDDVEDNLTIAERKLATKTNDADIEAAAPAVNQLKRKLKSLHEKKNELKEEFNKYFELRKLHS